MPVPKVNYCIVCDGIRPEPNNKANILGFFGVLPSVTVAVGELGKLVPVLVFLVGMEGPSDEVRIKGEIATPDGSPLAGSGDVSFPSLEKDDRGLAGFAFAPVKFDQAGEYSFRLYIHDKLTYESTFVIREGLLPPDNQAPSKSLKLQT